MHLQAGKRRSKLMGRIGEEALLHRARFAKLRQQAVESFHRGSDLCRRGALVQRAKIVRRAYEAFTAKRPARFTGR